MDTLDLKRTLKHLYSASAKPQMVEVPEMTFLMIDGAGDPNTSQAFQEAMGALYGTAYTLKFMLKKGAEDPVDFAVMPPEGLWWCEGREDFCMEEKGKWLWTLMIALPDFVTAEHFAEACRQLRERKDPPGLDKLRLERFCEGLCAQVMHLGPYADEPATIAKLHAFIAEQGQSPGGKHHEIYFSDPRRTPPEKMKTILRQPVR
ncbi:MAG: hypothetical protein FJX75_07545 [Armatimonadetes bacterium]|nr:hypothetical protein [Armatimonadota bacterium]